ncbi:MAG: MBOAT family O-acyltransferase [Bariatricus massiliensis]|nr:MBOAT family O-acyltransferase [Bariatricus massiliensis]
MLKKFRLLDCILVILSLFFYSWACFDDVFKLIVYVIIVWGAGICLHKVKAKKKLPTIMSVIALIAVLFYFKYYNFFIEIWNNLLATGVKEKNILAPLGVSFIVFSTISYIVDIYRGEAEAGNILDTALYLTFFPKVISGPIMLYKDFKFQNRDRIINLEKFVYGINRIIIGLAKKVILADTFGILVETIQADSVYGIDVLTAWGGALLYMFQIYYDFSGYSDIAIGLGNMFGFRIKENFNFPYISSSITEFWRRWHISLGTWFREYLYIPLGGNRKGKIRTLLNLFVVFTVTGIWHGAGWNYIIWGAFHGVFIVAERCIRNTRIYCKIPKYIKWSFTMFIVYIGWEIFRLQSLSEIIRYVKIMLGNISFPTVNFTFAYYFDFRILVLLVIAVFGATIFSTECFVKCKKQIEKYNIAFLVQEIGALFLFILSILFMINSTYSPFLYFQY